MQSPFTAVTSLEMPLTANDEPSGVPCERPDVPVRDFKSVRWVCEAMINVIYQHSPMSRSYATCTHPGHEACSSSAVRSTYPRWTGTDLIPNGTLNHRLFNSPLWLTHHSSTIFTP